MARKIKVKLILELRESGLSQREICKTRNMSRHSISNVFKIADEASIAWNDVKEKSEEDVYRIFYPDKYADDNMFQNPDYPYVHSELKKIGVTLKLLWQEYKEAAAKTLAIPMGYSKFCDGYSEYTVRSNITNHLVHKPGIVCEVDWSGPKMQIVQNGTGEVITVYLFVATLPYSQYSYVEPCFDMKENTWLKCNVNMFEFFGGSTIRTVCDNLKTGVISHPREGDIILNAHYESFGNHYCTAIMPAGVRRPRQKASVEGTVGKIATAIIAKLRNEQFHSMDELKIAVHNALMNFNNAPFQKREGSRTEIFKTVESDSLRKLPILPFEVADWIYGRSANIDCHVVYAKNRYSCPYQYVGKKIDLKITESLLEIYLNGERLTTHKKFPDYVVNDWSTHKEDMPDQFQRPEWDDKRIKSWAYAIGKYTGEVVDRIFESVSIKERGYNSALSVLRLSKSYSQERLETACEMALAKIRIPRYKHLKSILAANQDAVYLNEKVTPGRPKADTSFGYIRGAAYYGGAGDDDDE